MSTVILQFPREATGWRRGSIHGVDFHLFKVRGVTTPQKIDTRRQFSTVTLSSPRWSIVLARHRRPLTYRRFRQEEI